MITVGITYVFSNITLRLMSLTVLLAKCLSVHSHMLTILCLLRQSSRPMRRMLFTYDSFADNFSIVFNAKKIKAFII